MKLTAQEIWKDIEGWEGLYQISNQGKVKRLDRIVIRSGTRGNAVILGKILNQNLHKGGYLRLTLSKDQIERKKLVHRLVAVAFVENPLNLPEVNHKDHDPSNNNDWNLEWSSTRENNTHKFFNIKKSSRYPNVSWSASANSWIVVIQIKGKQKYFGKFNDEEEAHSRVIEVLAHNKIINKYAEVCL